MADKKIGWAPGFILVALIGLLVAAIGFMAACATTTSSIKEAHQYFESGDFDRSIEVLQNALAAKPDNQELRTMLFRARLNNYYAHLARAREKRQAGQQDQAIQEYRVALGIFPNNTRLQEEVDLYAGTPKKTADQEAVSDITPPVQLAIKKDERVSLNIKNTPISSIFKSLGKTFNINFVFDKDFRDFLHSIEIENKTFNEVLKVLCMVSASLYRPIDANTVFIYPDIFAKKKSFDLRGIKTFYLSNIKAEDAKKLILTVFREDQTLLLQEEPNLNALIVRSDYSTLVDIEKFIRHIDIEKNEVEINIEIMEINRNLIKKLGADLTSAVFNLAIGNETSDGEIDSTMELNAIGDANFYLTIPTLALSFLESDDHNKIIAKPNLRGLDGEEISFMVGDEIPIPETQFQAIAAGGINTSPVTTYRYKNVGVEIKVTPFIHQNGEVTLKTKLTINFISGGSFSSSFPTLGKREIENRIRLKEGETNIIGGFIRDDIRNSLKGLPILARIPLLGKLFGNTEKTIAQTDLIFSITPRIIRKIPITPQNRQPIWTNVDQSAAATSAPAGPPRPPRPESAGGPEAAPERGAPKSSVTITPSQLRLPVNSDSFFSVAIKTDAPLASLSLHGTLSGGRCEIVDLVTETGSDSIKVLKNIAGNGFDVGFSFADTVMAPTSTPPIQLKVKFLDKGNYTLAIDSLSAYDQKRNRIDIPLPAAAVIEIF